MKNNKLIKYKENIFTKISNFCKKLFFRGKENIIEDNDKSLIYRNQNKESFAQNLIIEENQEEKRLKNLQLQYDNEEIYEDDISDEDMDKLIEMYEDETEELNADSERRKIHIAQMLKELNQS